MAVAHPKGGNLPIELNTFIGRESELAHLARIQASTRLLTLVGPGGVGKSRLALRLASACQEHVDPDSTWFVELAHAADSSTVAQSVCDAICARADAAESALDAVVRTLRSRRALLVLDNCEHLLAACSQLASALVQTCPGVRIIATSRSPLHISGDVIWRVPPLSLPSAAATEPGEVASSEAVQLFVDRVRRHDPGFELTPENTPCVVSICRGLDGLPLALELVAARMGDMHSANAEQVTLDVAGPWSPLREPRRHQTLKATLDWSNRLLSDSDRRLLRRLSVFVDGCSLQAAECVCSDEALCGPAVAASLGRLVACSLVLFDSRASSGTYYLLATVKQYAYRLLRHAGEVEQIQRRHFVYMLALAEQQPPEALDPGHAQRLARDQHNIHAALRWALRIGNGEGGLRLATAACPLWIVRGQLADGRCWFERLLGLRGVVRASTAERARIWLSQIALRQGDHATAERLLHEALFQPGPDRDETGLALRLLMLGHAGLRQGDLRRAQQLYDEAVPRLRVLKNPGEFVALYKAAIIACELGDTYRAVQLGRQCHTWLKRAGRTPEQVMYLRGVIAASNRKTGHAIQLLAKAREAAQIRGEQWLVGDAARDLGHVLMDNGVLEQASGYFAEAIDIADREGDLIRLSRALEGFARVIGMTEPSAAIQLLGAAQSIRTAHSAVAWPSDRRHVDGWLPIAQSRLRGRGYTVAMAAGRALNVHAAVTLARHLLEQRKELRDGRPESLTPREHDVLTLLARGQSNQQIASELNISAATVRTHVDRILSKLKLHSRTQAALWANEHVLI